MGKRESAPEGAPGLRGEVALIVEDALGDGLTGDDARHEVARRVLDGMAESEELDELLDALTAYTVARSRAEEDAEDAEEARADYAGEVEAGRVLTERLR